MIDVTPLFAPLPVKHLTLRNRLVMPPMETYRGRVREAARVWYGRRRRPRAGLVIVEATKYSSSAPA